MGMLIVFVGGKEPRGGAQVGAGEDEGTGNSAWAPLGKEGAVALARLSRGTNTPGQSARPRLSRTSTFTAPLFGVCIES
eukprot:2659355-Pyramimonas_sp.AAC.1